MQNNRCALAGSIYPIEQFSLEDGVEALFSPGIEYEWETGKWCSTRGAFIRRDGELLRPKFFSPFPGHELPLNDLARTSLRGAA